MSDSAGSVLRRFGPMIYGPTALFGLGEGAVIPLIPIVAARLGADLALSGFIATMLVIGQLCGNLPAGWAVSRFGERATMLSAAALALVGAAGFIYAPNLVVLTLSVFVIGLCAAAFGLARHAFLALRAPLHFRARALALLGGTLRFGMFVGPFIAAALLWLTGTEAAAAWFFIACLAGCLLMVGLGRDPGQAVESAGSRDTPAPLTATAAGAAPRQPGVFATMLRHRGVLSRLGLAAATLSATRQSRQIVLPLWGVSLGLDGQTIALIVGIGGACDFALFYASGQIMDRFGRLWVILPSMLGLGLGFLVLSLTHDLPSAVVWFTALTAVLGIANGVSSGVLMTLGADLAPPRDPAPFLGSWRMLNDTGGALVPLLFSALASVVTIGGATAAIGAISLLGAAGFARWVPRYAPRGK